MKDTKKEMSARFWTKKECAGTLKECVEAGFRVEGQGSGFTKVFNGEDLVVSFMQGATGQRFMVRVDLNYWN